MIAQIFPVQEYFGVLLNAVEFKVYLLALIRFAYRQMFAVPSPAIPPVGIIVGRRIADVGVQLAGRFVGLPGVGNRDDTPFGIIKRRIFITAVFGILFGKIVEGPLGVNRFFDPG